LSNGQSHRDNKEFEGLILIFLNGQCHSDNKEFEGFTLHIQKMTTTQLKQTEKRVGSEAMMLLEKGPLCSIPPSGSVPVFSFNIILIFPSNKIIHRSISSIGCMNHVIQLTV